MTIIQKGEPMSDTISRQAAITALSHMCSEDEKGITVSRANVDSMLKSSPPAQPEERTAERTETRACDSIGRQMAIDAIDEQIEWCDKSLSSFDISMKDEFAVKVERASLVAFRETLECLPTAQPEWKWTPVSERLPEESGYCIITAHDGVGHRTTFAKFQKKAKSWDLTGARSYWRVIAWMPMPEPYQEGETT